MRIMTHQYSDITVVELAGEFKSDYSEAFKQAIEDVIASFRSGVVVDMSRVTFIDSIGLGQLLWAKDYCDKNSRQFSLAGLDKNCEKVLEIAGLKNEFDRHPALAGAVKSFGPVHR